MVLGEKNNVNRHYDVEEHILSVPFSIKTDSGDILT